MPFENETPEEKTYRYLTRTPFLEVIDHASASIWGQTGNRDHRMNSVIKLWSQFSKEQSGYVVNQPSPDWLEYYTKNGWTIQELFDEACKVHEAKNGK